MRKCSGFLTREEVAHFFGITETRVMQIERNALKKIRRRLEAEGFRMSDWIPHAAAGNSSRFLREVAPDVHDRNDVPTNSY